MALERLMLALGALLVAILFGIIYYYGYQKPPPPRISWSGLPAAHVAAGFSNPQTSVFLSSALQGPATRPRCGTRLYQFFETPYPRGCIG